jgi:transposase
MLGQLTALEQQMADLTSEIEQRVACYDELIGRISTVPGLDRISAWTVSAEVGTDMNVFGDAPHLASWGALCPGNRQSGGKRIRGKTRKGNRYVRRILCQSAWAGGPQEGFALGGLVPPRAEPPRGTEGHHGPCAPTHYNHLPHYSRWQRISGTRSRILRSAEQTKGNCKLVDRLQRLGYYVTLQPIQTPNPIPDAVPVAVTKASNERRKRGSSIGLTAEFS